VTAGSPDALGAAVDDAGATFAVFSEHAEQITLCLFSPDGRREIARLPLPERTGDVWHGHVAGLKPGQLYGLRADGPWNPDKGQRFNPAKLLLDPYAKAFHGDFDPTSALLLGHDPVFGETERSSGDSASAMPKCVLTAPLEPVPDDERPLTPWDRTIIYEAHVKGFTQRHPAIEPGAARHL
jgi:isoamylase